MPVFVVKTDKAIPYISAPYRKGIINAIRSFFMNIPILDTKGRVIELVPWPTCVRRVKMRDDGEVAKEKEVDVMEFRDDGSPESERLKERTKETGPVVPDVVIVASGYRREFPFLSDGGYPTLRECGARGVYERIEDGFAYVGFIRPAIGEFAPFPL